MADYQEYRRRVLHRRWRRRFMAAGLLFLLVLLGEPNRKLENGSQQIYQDAAALLDWAVDAFSIGSAPAP